MSKISIQVYTTLRELIGTDKIELDAKDVKDALEQLKQKFGDRLVNALYDENGRIKSYYIILLNGHTVDKKRLKQTKLNPGDTIHIFPPVAGG